MSEVNINGFEGIQAEERPFARALYETFHTDELPMDSQLVWQDEFGVYVWRSPTTGCLYVEQEERQTNTDYAWCWIDDYIRQHRTPADDEDKEKRGDNITEEDIRRTIRRFADEGDVTVTSGPFARAVLAVATEREYQEERWDDNYMTVGEEILLIQRYVAHASTAWAGKPRGEEVEALHVMRKIAGIAIRCMENHGAPLRGESP